MTATATHAGGPLRRVLDALHAGAATRVELERHTGLSPELVDAAIEHLVRSGRVRREQLGGGCPEAGCGGCPSARTGADGAGQAGPAGCGSGARITSRGPVALTLRRPDRPA